MTRKPIHYIVFTMMEMVHGIGVVLRIKEQIRHTTVYNMEVADYHTYYVGEDSVWVHNMCQTKPGTFLETGSEDGGISTDVKDKLVDGSSMKTDDALDLATEFLGEGYTEPVPGSGRFVSADGTRVFRMGKNDILGKHGGGSHVNFEILSPNSAKPGKMQVITDIHIFLED